MTVFGRTPAINSKNAKIAQNYDFAASSKAVTILESDFLNFLLVVNQTTGQTIYEPNSSFSGSVNNTVLTFDISNSGMADGDNLLILYESSNILEQELLTTMQSIVYELKAINEKLDMILD